MVSLFFSGLNVITFIGKKYQHWARVVGYSPFSLCVIHKEGLYPSSGDINRLMMMVKKYCLKQLPIALRTRVMYDDPYYI
jgi:hypothetical protein